MSAAAGGSRFRTPLLVAVSAAAALTLVLLARNAPPFREISDGAILELYTLRALEGRLLVGPYSRFGWHHPGPLFFYLEAPWYWLSGYHTAGMQAGALAVNVAAFALIAWTVTRARPERSRGLAIALLAAAAIYVVRSGDLIVSPWNPHVVILPLIAFVTIGARFAVTGDRKLLLWLVVLGSFLVQTHLAMAPIIATIAGAACVIQRAALSRHRIAASVLGLALWFPSILEQVIHRPGNFTRVVGFFLAGSEGQNAGTAFGAWATALTAGLRPELNVANGSYLATDAPFAIPAAIALMAALAVVAVRPSSDRFVRILGAFSAVAMLVALAATTRIHDRIVDHEVFWMSALGALGAGVTCAAIIDRVTRASRTKVAETLVRAVSAAAWIAIAAAAIAGFAHVMNRSRTTDDHSVDVLAEQIEQYFHASNARRPLIHIEPPIWPIAAGSLLQIAKADRSFAVDRRWVTVFGEWFAETGSEDGELTISGSPLQPRLEGKR